MEYTEKDTNLIKTDIGVSENNQKDNQLIQKTLLLRVKTNRSTTTAWEDQGERIVQQKIVYN